MSRVGVLLRALRTGAGLVRRARSLSGSERWLALEAALALLRVEAEVRLRGYPSWRWRVEAEEPTGARGTPAASPPEVRRWVALFEAVTRRLPWAPTCLVRTLALRALLARRGVDTAIRFGVGVPSGALEAHCWLEHRGGAIYGHAPERYGTLGRGRG